MPSLTDREIKDLVIGTLDNYGPPRFQLIAQDLQEYEIMSKWLKKGKVLFDSGQGIKRTLMSRTGQAAKHVGLAEEDTVNIPDLLDQLDVPWRHATTNWAFIRHEALMNRGEALITNIVEPRRVGAMIDLADELEDKGWAVPGTTDKLLPYGIPYWVVKATAANSTDTFNGGYPVDSDGNTHSSVAGVNLTDSPNFKNWNDTYTLVNRDDLIRKMRKAALYTKFKAPIQVKDYSRGSGARRRIYMNYDTQLDFEEVATAQNENLGPDVAYMDGMALFRRTPITGVAQLNSDTSDPVYGIDHNKFYMCVLRGDYLRESDPEKAAKQHNVFEVFVDLTYNYLCLDRRCQWVINKV
jgi:hypothetical protein